MSLAAPWALLLLALAWPIVAAFLRRPPPQRRPVASLLLLRALASAPGRRRRPPPRELLALLLFLLALLSAVLGLALRPDRAPDHILATFDTSASSSLRRPDALGSLRRALRRYPAAALSVVTTSPPRLLVDRTRDHHATLRQLAALPSAGAERPLELDALLGALCDRPDPPLLLALHDAPLAAPPPPCPLSRPDLSSSARNTGITSITARHADGLGLVELAFSAEVQAPDTTATVLADGRPVGATPLPEGSSERLLRLDLAPDTRTVEVALASAGGGDGWPEDDRAAADLAPLPAARILLVTDAPEGFTAAALQAHPRADLTIRPPPLPEDPGGTWDLLVVEGEGVLIGAAARGLARRIVVLGADASALGVGRGAAVRGPEARVLEAASPLLRYVSLERLHIEAGSRLGAPAEATILMASDQGPLIVQVGEDLLVLGFDPARSDLVLRADFVHLLANIVEWALPPLPPPPPPRGVLSLVETRDAASAEAEAGAVLPGMAAVPASLAALVMMLLLLAEWPLQAPLPPAGGRR